MESILQILQTIGICVSAIALVIIAFFIFMLWSSFFPAPDLEDEENALFIDGEELEEDKAYRKRKRRPRKH
ncbi:MAG: hypothetical protein P8074_20965 [Anaerolineales bacterium]|jgi:hypothetical protein